MWYQALAGWLSDLDLMELLLRVHIEAAQQRIAKMVKISTTNIFDASEIVARDENR